MSIVGPAGGGFRTMSGGGSKTPSSPSGQPGGVGWITHTSSHGMSTTSSTVATGSIGSRTGTGGPLSPGSAGPLGPGDGAPDVDGDADESGSGLLSPPGLSLPPEGGIGSTSGSVISGGTPPGGNTHAAAMRPPEAAASSTLPREATFRPSRDAVVNDVAKSSTIAAGHQS